MERVVLYAAMFLLLTAPGGGLALAEDEPNQEGPHDQGGLHGYVIACGIAINGNPSHLAAADNRRQIKSLDSEHENLSELKFGMLGGVSYTFKERGTTLSLVLDMEHQGSIFTIAQPLPDGRSVSLGAGNAKEEVWRNPYLTGANRSETDMQKYYVTADYQNGKESGWTLSGTWTALDVDRDTIGEQVSALKRDGTQWQVSTGYLFSLGAAGSLHAFINYSRQELDGRSNSSDSTGFTLKHNVPLGRFSLETSVAYNQTDYDHRHPIFDKTRSEQGWTATETISYTGLFHDPHYMLYAVLSYSRNDANIDFFDSEMYACILGIGYTF